MNKMFVLAAFVLVGCTNLRDLNVSEFRTEEFYNRTATFNKSVKELSNILVSYQNNCKAVPQIVMNPNNTSGTISWQVGELASGATMAVMDFEEENNKKVTHVKIYSANIFWEKRPENILKILESAGKCE